jgi:hypothetical protein
MPALNRGVLPLLTAAMKRTKTRLSTSRSFWRSLRPELDGADDAKNGLITVIAAADDTVQATVILNPLADTGFKAAGDALARTAPPRTPAPDDFKFVTGAYQNQLNNIAIKGDFAFLPATGASRTGRLALM